MHVNRLSSLFPGSSTRPFYCTMVNVIYWRLIRKVVDHVGRHIKKKYLATSKTNMQILLYFRSALECNDLQKKLSKSNCNVSNYKWNSRIKIEMLLIRKVKYQRASKRISVHRRSVKKTLPFAGRHLALVATRALE